MYDYDALSFGSVGYWRNGEDCKRLYVVMIHNVGGMGHSCGCRDEIMKTALRLTRC